MSVAAADAAGAFGHCPGNLEGPEGLLGVQGGLVDGVLEGLRVQSQGDLGVLGGQEAQVAQRMKMVALRGGQQAQGASGDQMGVQGVLYKQIHGKFESQV